jgi:intracellular multiplication protein IcmW
MPDLSRKAAHQFWQEYKDTFIYRVVSFMESVENWTLDGNPAFEEGIQKLGDALENIGGIDLQQEDQFIKIATFIKMSRTLRLMQCLDTAHPGAASKLLMRAEEATQANDDIYGLFLRKNMVFERLRLLGRVFAKERLDLILSALEGR